MQINKITHEKEDNTSTSKITGSLGNTLATYIPITEI
jgi:hypothetical protein